MAVNQTLLADRFRKYRDNFGLSISQLAVKTGISEERLSAFESASILPTGDELLIIADVYLVNDYRVFLLDKDHNEPFEQIETLFRKFGNDLTTNDRWAIQEVVYLAECEAFLENELGKVKRPFTFTKSGTNFKLQAEQAAIKLRKHLGYPDKNKTLDIFQDIRNIGIHIFRRTLDNTSISGIFIKHPTAGKCILVNYNEDTFRQRFTAAHELAHSILDLDGSEDIDLTKTSDSSIEARGNAFASYYLLPSQLIERIPEKNNWDAEKLKIYAKYFEVNPETLTYALARENCINQSQVKVLKKNKLLRIDKIDSEFSNVSKMGIQRKYYLQKRGISEYYVRLCMDAKKNHLISSAKMAEMLLINLSELKDIYDIFGENYYES
ncbi:XRE family transcriptional regulator [Paenibacillus xylanexedens]|uniref:XRE family transcriptional regulator n=1 Tax=Paenibacillus xylanexedens TaxID=528191 RepID=UPI003D024E53